MTEAQVLYSEWVPGGVMVHFADNHSVFFSAEFLFTHRDQQPPAPAFDDGPEDVTG